MNALFYLLLFSMSSFTIAKSLESQFSKSLLQLKSEKEISRIYQDWTLYLQQKQFCFFEQPNKLLSLRCYKYNEILYAYKMINKWEFLKNSRILDSICEKSKNLRWLKAQYISRTCYRMLMNKKNEILYRYGELSTEL